MIDYRRFGDQPLICLMRRHRYSYTLLADEIGVSRAQLVLRSPWHQCAVTRAPDQAQQLLWGHSGRAFHACGTRSQVQRAHGAGRQEPLAGSGCRVTTYKIDWSLSPAERELLRRDCEASKVPIAVEDSDAIKRLIALITKVGDQR